MTEIKTVYAVHQGDDERHCGKPEWFFTDKDQAEDVADGRGWFGGKAPVSTSDVIVVGDKA